ncbi:ATPase [Synergistales bacterium]|nr:ATPase [Synergistales bacterium]
MDFIKRTRYMDILKKFKDKQLIKVVSGVRRCGKSTLLSLFCSYLKQKGVADERIVFINFEDIKYELLTEYHALYDYISSLLIPEPDKMNYVFLDEIQHVPQFEKAVDSLFIKGNVDIYITGSNAWFMSGELATLLAGRYIEIGMLPLSFAEYCEGSAPIYATREKKSLNERFSDYLSFSSFPYALKFDMDRQGVGEYLRGIYNTVLLKDVVSRQKISDVSMLESVARFIFDNVGNPLSTTKIANTMTSMGRKIDLRTVEKYIKGLTDSLILYKADRYNIKGKQHLATLSKYYAVDAGLRYAILGYSGSDIGHMLENAVYLELRRRGGEVYVGQSQGAEVDFVVIGKRDRAYYQAAATVREKATLDRELHALRQIKDNYPKYILTLDEDPDDDYDGIKKINALRWMLG